MQDSKRKAEANAGFKTRAAREQEEKARERKYPKVGIYFLLLLVWSSLKEFHIYFILFFFLDNDSSEISRWFSITNDLPIQRNRYFHEILILLDA